MEKNVDKVFDEMLDNVKSINDDFINNYFEDDNLPSSVREIDDEIEKNDTFPQEKSGNLDDYIENKEKTPVENLTLDDYDFDSLINSSNKLEDILNIDDQESNLDNLIDESTYENEKKDEDNLYNDDEWILPEFDRTNLENILDDEENKDDQIEHNQNIDDQLENVNKDDISSDDFFRLLDESKDADDFFEKFGELNDK